MSPASLPWLQIGLLGVEAAAIAAVLLGLFRLRRVTGLSPLYITVGALQQLQVLLAVSIYVEIRSGLLISPGSAVLFPASLFVMLLVYLRHDASEARRLVYGLVLANLALAGLSWLVSLHLGADGTVNFLALPRELFVQNLRVLLVGTSVLLADVMLVIVAYEFFARWLGRSLFLTVLAAMLGVLAFDTVLFSLGAFWGRPELSAILVSGLVGKSAMAVPYSLLLALYLRRSDRHGRSRRDWSRAGERFDLFRHLSYRQRFEEARELALRDPLTGLHNRRYFEELLPVTLERAARSGSSAGLLVIDIDRFKSINDQLGHPAGDAVLRHVAGVLRGAVRSQDLVCRYGGDELVVLLPAVDPPGAAAIEQRIRDLLASSPAPPGGIEVTLSIGCALYPSDAATAEQLLATADGRLYAGRRQRRPGEPAAVG